MGETAKATDLCRQGRFLLSELHVYQGKINRLLGRVAVRENDVQEARVRAWEMKRGQSID